MKNCKIVILLLIGAFSCESAYKDLNNGLYADMQTSKGNVLKARQDLYNYIHSIAKDVWKKTGGQKPINEVFKILYALPQLRDTENMTEPITMDKMNGET